MTDELMTNETLYQKLHSTTDVTVWAEEWVKIARKIVRDSGDQQALLDEGWMIGWFANYAQAANDLMISKRIVHPGSWFAFKYFYHQDCANAAMHQGSVRFSPITFRLAEFLWESYPLAEHPEPAYGGTPLRRDVRLQEVMQALDTYKEDRGREAVE